MTGLLETEFVKVMLLVVIMGCLLVPLGFFVLGGIGFIIDHILEDRAKRRMTTNTMNSMNTAQKGDGSYDNDEYPFFL